MEQSQYRLNRELEKMDEKSLSEKRLEICKQCPHFRKEFKLWFIELKYPQCGLCKCNLKWKTPLPFADCPEKKWKDVS